MKITIYELLGLIKDDKEPPKKIKYNDEIWEYYKDLKNYTRAGKPNTLFTMYYIHNILNNEVEIIEEDKKIEKLNIPCNFICSTNGMAKEDLEHLDFNFKEIENKINELIEEIEKLKGKSE